MMQLCLVTPGLLLLASHLTAGYYDKNSRLVLPHMESYWESWTEGGSDFASNLTDLDVTPVGSRHGVNIINLAFARPGYGSCEVLPVEERLNCTLLPGYEGKEEALRQAVKTIHQKNGFVKIAVGGDTYDNPTPGDNFYATRLAATVGEYNLDGVDFVVSRWTGFNQAGTGDMINELRQRLPSKMISLTLPSCGYPCDYYRTIVNMTMDQLDYINMFRATEADIGVLENEYGVPRHKIVWGIQVTQDCLMADTMAAATMVREGGYSGVSTWSVNSDTAQRADYEYATCNEFQTGHPDGTYINMISYLLHA